VCHVGLCQHKFDPNENKNVTRCIVNIGDTPSLSNILEYFQPEKFKDLVKNNITGAIMIFSGLLWVSLTGKPKALILPRYLLLCSSATLTEKDENIMRKIDFNGLIICQGEQFMWLITLKRSLSFSYTYPNINPDMIPSFPNPPGFAPDQSYALKVKFR
jgi:hypothetical protein